jgi:hypothetical protein
MQVRDGAECDRSRASTFALCGRNTREGGRESCSLTLISVLACVPIEHVLAVAGMQHELWQLDVA